jgi:hypothetical protein
MKSLSAYLLFVTALAGVQMSGQDSQTVNLSHKLQIPGATLKPGEYTFAVEDRLEDRAIIRITSGKQTSHELLLAVPSDKLNQTEHGKLIFFPTEQADKQILQGWMCPSCQSALELVYPKDEAVKITAESAKPVIAVDPTYDKLPKNLSPDDMKVVTLWLLSPKEITPEQRGKGVDAVKYADTRKAQPTQTASSAAPLTATSPSPSDDETAKAIRRATAPPPVGAVATTNSGMPASTAGNSSSTSSASAPDSKPIMDDRTPEIPTISVKPAATEPKHASEQMASVRHMPHTASNTYSFGLVGLAMLLAAMALHVQRKFRPFHE